jgi:hypothetical protein
MAQITVSYDRVISVHRIGTDVEGGGFGSI